MIRLEFDGPVATLTLARPDRRNALTPEMLVAMREAIAGLPDTARALVLAGEGKVFCSGFDLELCHSSPDGTVMRSLLTGLAGVIQALRAGPVPVVAAVTGGAIAGGCAFLGGADVVVSHRGAKFGYPVTRIGVSPAVSGPFLAGLVGSGHARERMLDSGLVDGVEAGRIGLVHELVAEAHEVLPAAVKCAAVLADKPPGAMAATRRWLFELDAMASPQRAAAGLAASIGLAGGPEEREMLGAFRKS